MSTQLNLEIEQGTTETIELTWLDDSTGLPKDLTNYTAKMQVRSDVGDPNVLLEYSTANGGISLGDVTGVVTIFIMPTDTTNFTTIPEWHRGVYDLLLTQGTTNAVTCVARGYFIIIPRATQ